MPRVGRLPVPRRQLLQRTQLRWEIAARQQRGQHLHQQLRLREIGVDAVVSQADGLRVGGVGGQVLMCTSAVSPRKQRARSLDFWSIIGSLQPYGNWRTKN